MLSYANISNEQSKKTSTSFFPAFSDDTDWKPENTPYHIKQQSQPITQEPGDIDIFSLKTLSFIVTLLTKRNVSHY